MSYDEWVMDVTNWPIRSYSPMRGDDVVMGLCVITDKCPGKLIGVIHLGGNGLAERWVSDHPAWRDE